MHAVFMRSVRWCYWILNKIDTSQGITVNIRNIQNHKNAFSIYPVFTQRRTDRNVYRNQKTYFCNCHPELPQTCDRVNVYCLCLVLERDRVTVILAAILYSILSVQIIYSVQLNCTESIYRETE